MLATSLNPTHLFCSQCCLQTWTLFWYYSVYRENKCLNSSSFVVLFPSLKTKSTSQLGKHLGISPALVSCLFVKTVLSLICSFKVTPRFHTQRLFPSGLNRSTLVWNLTKKMCILLHFVSRCCRYGVGRKRETESCWKCLKVAERQPTRPGHRAAQEGDTEQISLIFSFHAKDVFYSVSRKSCFLDSFTLVPSTPTSDRPHPGMPSTIILWYREILFLCWKVA